MEKVELKKISFFKEDDESERDAYLKELGESTYHYLKTGVKNRQLDDLIFLEEEFQEKYEQRFDIKSIADMISEKSKDKLLEISSVKAAEDQDHSFGLSKKNNFSCMLENVTNQITNIVFEVVNSNLQRILKDAAYLSHVNMIYEMCEREDRSRREERDFDKISEAFKKMADVAVKLGENKRMELAELEQQINISQEDMEDLLNGCSSFFNVRDRKNNVQISLSPKGRKYNEYVLNFQKKYSNDTVNQLIYKNCNNLMESLENSYKKGVQYELRIEGLNPDKESALKHKYRRITQEFIAASEEIYSTKELILKAEKESVSWNYEENKFRISDEWGEDIY